MQGRLRILLEKKYFCDTKLMNYVFFNSLDDIFSFYITILRISQWSNSFDEADKKMDFHEYV